MSLVPLEHGQRLTDTYVQSFSTPCMVTEHSIVTGDVYNGKHFDCTKSPISPSLDTMSQEKPEAGVSRYISFVEVQNAGHNWVFTRREWLATVPEFINRFS